MKIKQGVKRVLVPTTKLLVSGLALYFVFTRIPLQEVKTLVFQVNMAWLIPALVLFVLSKWVSSLRLNRFFRAVRCDLNDRLNHKLYLLGMYYNLFLPGGIGGDGYKVYLLNRKFGYPAQKVFWAVILDRVTGVTALVCLALLLSHVLEIPVFYVGLVWSAIPVVLFVTWLVFRFWFKDFITVFESTTLQSFVVQLLQVLSALCILLSLGEYTRVSSYMLVFLASSIIAIFPFTIGGVGAREITFLYGSTWLGLDTGVSIALSLLFYLITVFVSLFGMYYSFYPGELSPDKSSISYSLTNTEHGGGADVV